MAYDIRKSGSDANQWRLRSTALLTVSDFHDIATNLQTTPLRARKIGFVAARCASSRTQIETLWNGVETSDVAEPGDWIVTNLSPAREVLRDSVGNANTYVIRSYRFPELYAFDHGQLEHGQIFKAIGEVSALYFPAGFEILAPWNKFQRADAGYLILNGDEVYGNATETFEATYEVL